MAAAAAASAVRTATTSTGHYRVPRSAKQISVPPTQQTSSSRHRQDFLQSLKGGGSRKRKIGVSPLDAVEDDHVRDVVVSAELVQSIDRLVSTNASVYSALHNLVDDLLGSLVHLAVVGEDGESAYADNVVLR